MTLQPIHNRNNRNLSTTWQEKFVVLKKGKYPSQRWDIETNDHPLEPTNYDKMRHDEQKWLKQASQIVQDIFHHPKNPIYVVPWQDKTIAANRMVSANTITSEILTKLFSPQITHINSYSMSIIGIQICTTDSTFTTGN
jgi:hypothetical protein